MILKQIKFIKTFIRNYSSINDHQTINIKEIIKKTVDPFSKIHVSSKMNLKIQPYDLLDCPDGNLLRASVIKNSNLKNHYISSKNFDIQVKDNNIKIQTNINNNDINENYTCILEVPVRSDLNINTNNNIEVKEMHSDSINLISSNGNIETRNLRSTLISLHSKNGNINCKGLLLGQKTSIKTEKSGVRYSYIDELFRKQIDE